MNKLQSYAKSQPQIIAIYMYGSQVKGYAASNSDTDVAVVVENRQNLKDELKLMMEVSDNLEVKNPDVRVVDINSNKTFLFNIIKQNRLIYQRDEMSRNRFESDVLTRFYDQKYIRGVYDYFLLKQIKEETHGRGPVDLSKTFGQA